MRGVSKYFDGGETVANYRIDLEVEDGEFLSLLGPSGCGKTTALRLIAGLETPSEGEIYFDDERVDGLSPSTRNVAMVFQNYALYPHMSVRENIAYPLKVRGMPPDERDRKIAEAIELLHIEDQVDKPPAELSGGQRQRVALARAIVRDPVVFLMDEPLSNLDAKLRQEMRGELKRLQDELGITTIYVTHNQEEAMSMADRVAVMNRGTIRQLAPPAELYERPRTEWVARFVGSPPMNLLRGTRRDGAIDLGEAGTVDLAGVAGAGREGAAVRTTGREEAAVETVEADVGASISLGVRPEDLSVATEPPPGGNAIEGSVDTVEPLGEYTIVNVVVNDQLVNAKVGDADVKRDDRVYLTFDDDDAYLYDEDGHLIA
ncbi:ABC transporter ATP-binding protein [Salinilacihabitans rarus]|uniref:ABC transporter ATP-binding protein n=1 Tax=Salinilacihabitans rarus TaxID=2961596 RepID=UPI0020C875D4|nr:ABC transporter ATP-binding protein [Salinilacihabitans rarus]